MVNFPCFWVCFVLTDESSTGVGGKNRPGDGPLATFEICGVDGKLSPHASGTKL